MLYAPSFGNPPKSFILFAVLGIVPAISALGVPQGFSVQGRLTDSNGINRDGSHGVQFSIFNAAQGGTLLWTRSYDSVAVSNGHFQQTLEDVGGQPLLASIFNGPARWLEIRVLSGPGISAPEQPMSPRQPINSVPYAVMAEQALALVSSSTATISTGGQDRMVVTPSGNIGVGISVPTATFHLEGSLVYNGKRIGTLALKQLYRIPAQCGSVGGNITSLDGTCYTQASEYGSCPTTELEDCVITGCSCVCTFRFINACFQWRCDQSYSCPHQPFGFTVGAQPL